MPHRPPPKVTFASGVPLPEAPGATALNGEKYIPRGNPSKDSRVLEREIRMRKVLGHVAAGRTVTQAVALANLSWQTYLKWRARFPEFKAMVDQARTDAAVYGEIERRTARLAAATASGRHLEVVEALQADIGELAFDFVEERRQWFGMDSPWFHVEAATLYMTLPPGSVAIFLFPPEHGKTTLFEDYASIRLAHDPDWRFMVGSEDEPLARKIVGRVRRRMDPEWTLYPRWVENYGPFKGDRSTGQPWNQKFFNVVGKGRASEERNYSMEAIGFRGSVAGNRTDHLHLDDPQSLKSLGRTDKFVAEFRQDWLSRPGEDGITTINGTRVGAEDFYEVVIRELSGSRWGDLLRVIKYPAVMLAEDPGTGERVPVPLWPQKYTMTQLERMRYKVGEDAWWRGYMMEPRNAGTVHFDADALELCMDHERKMYMPAASDYLVVTCDPAIGSRCALAGLGFEGVNLVVHGLDERQGLMNNEQIMAFLWSFCLRLTERTGAAISDIVVEAKAFQAGLARDERLAEIARHFGASVREHQTGMNKYDENIGVTSMAHTIRRREVSIPYHPDDTEARYWADVLKAQFLAWRPGPGGGGRESNRGNRLRQDLLMAFWFGWILWRERRGRQRDVAAIENQFSFQGSPYTAGDRGLIIPVGASLGLR